MRRRTFIQSTGTATAGAMVGLSGCLGNGDDDDVDRIDIGVLGPLSGPFGDLGRLFTQGAGLAAMEHGQGDLSIELHEADSEVSSETAVRRARGLVEEQDVDAIVGIATSDVAMAVSEFAATQDVPLLITSGSTPVVTREECARSTFRIHASTQQHQYATAEGVLELTDFDADTRLATVLPDYALGIESWEYFSERMEDNLGGLNLVNEEYPEFGAGEFSDEIRRTINAEPDVVYTTLFVGDLIPFINQGHDFELFDEDIQMVFAGGAFLDVSMALGEDMVEGAIAYDHYYYEVPETDSNERFVERYLEEYDHVPYNIDQETYSAVKAVMLAAEESGGTEFMDIVEGLEGLEYDEPGGGKHIREEDHTTVEDFIPVARVGPTEDDRLDVMGFNDIYQVPGEDVTPEPDCDFDA